MRRRSPHLSQRILLNLRKKRSIGGNVLPFLGINQQSTESKNIPYHEPTTGWKLDNLFYFLLPTFLEAVETSWMAFYQLSVFSMPKDRKHCATAAKRWAMQKVQNEMMFWTEPWIAWSELRLLSIQLFCTKHLPGTKPVLECFSNVQLLASASKSFLVFEPDRT